MERLRGWLSCEDRPSVWSGSPNPNGFLPWSELVAILAGIDPERSDTSDAEGLSLLPGSLEFYGSNGDPRDEANRWNLNAGVAQQTAILAGLKLGTMNPAKAISLVFKAGIPIPWLKIAANDSECSQYLPIEVFNGQAKPKTGTFRAAQKIKRDYQIATDDKRKHMDDLGYQVFLNLKANDFSDCRKGEDKNINKTEIAERIIAAMMEFAPNDPDLWPKVRAVTKRVKGWLA